MSRKLVAVFCVLSISSCQTYKGAGSEIIPNLGHIFNAKSENPPSVATNSIGKPTTYLRDHYGEPNSFLHFANFDLFYYKQFVFKSDMQRIIVDFAELGNIFYNLDVESLSEPEQRKGVKSVAIVSGMEIPTDSLDFKAYAEPIRLLVSQSDRYRPLGKGEKYPDEILVVEYFISDPQKETTVWSVPRYNYVPSTNYSTSYYGNSGYVGSSYTTANNGGLYYAGSSVHSSTSTTFIRTLVIRAIDGKELGRTKKSKELWKVRIKSEGPKDELRQFVNDASMSSYRFWGLSIETTIKLLGYYTDPALEFLKEEQKK